MADIIIRKKKGFTAVQNYAVDDMTLSDKALGLYTRIQRWVTYDADDFVCSKEFIASRTPSGGKAFSSAWDELKEKGYLKMHCFAPASGTAMRWEAELLDMPEPDKPHTYYYAADGTYSSNNLDRAKKQAEKKAAEKPENEPAAGQETEPAAENPVEDAEIQPATPVNPPADHAEPPAESIPPLLGVILPEPEYYPQKYSNTKYPNTNGGNKNNTIDKTIDKTNIDSSLNQSIYLNNKGGQNFEKTPDAIDGIDFERWLIISKSQIAYDALAFDIDAGGKSEWEKEDDSALLNLIADCMALVYARKPDTVMRINGADMPVRSVQERFRLLTQFHIQYVMQSINQANRKITNLQAYVTAALFNAPVTMDTYYSVAARAAT